MTKEGIVLDVNDKYTTVKVERSSACGDCGKCGFASKDLFEIEVEAKNRVNAKQGDIVLLEDNSNLTLGSSVLYLIPLSFFILFTYIGIKVTQSEPIGFYLGLFQ